MADVTAAMDNLFNHPNVGPFIAYRLIQRFVTSNPSPGYVGRVAAAFADNGSGVRGDMKAVIKAILLDTEARDPAMMSQPTWGKLREPFCAASISRARSTRPLPSGHYALDQFSLAHLQDPMNSPSVFNFFPPESQPIRASWQTWSSRAGISDYQRGIGGIGRELFLEPYSERSAVLGSG